MVPYLLLGLGLLVGVLLLSRWFTSADPATLARGVRWILIVLGVALVAYLTATGRLFYALVTIPVLIPALMRWASLVRAVRARASGGRASAGQVSEVETPHLRMALDHDTGNIRGVVTAGRFAGRELGGLTVAELAELIAECRASDPQSVSLLETYAQRVHGEDWRAEAAAGAGAGPHGAGRSSFGAPMSREEAYEVLGLKPGASEEDIKRAHRELMIRLHPDQGGSNYLAARVNQAKDVLLKAR
ncbi:MAG: DnaJ domain-containing protein [Proteobacteria bacterium]|nr:DnaJ domain-containing protein [Pseudomonadota bacterium]